MSNQNIGIITSPISGTVALSNLVDILHSISGNLYLISGNDGYTSFMEDMRIHTKGVTHNTGTNTFTRILNYIHVQLLMSYKLAKIKNLDLWVFFMGDDLLIPMITAKLLNKSVVLIFAGSSAYSLKYANDKFFKPIDILSKINCALSNRIIFYTPNHIKEWHLEKYENKVSIAHEHIVDLNKFKIQKQLNERAVVVGYFGRLSGEKGVSNFVRAIPEISKRITNAKFFIGGRGLLRDKIEKHLSEGRLWDKVKLTGWIPHDELPKYLSDLKVLVLPSYTEGLPNIMLEAMACGTPALATLVGAIPDFIKDGETGFLMENNSPECIATNVIRALEYPDIEGVAQRARALVEREFTYEKAVERWSEILEDVDNDER